MVACRGVRQLAAHPAGVNPLQRHPTMNKLSILSAVLLLASMRCIAGGDGYSEAAEAYKADMKRDDPHLINGGFIGNMASSQAKRQVTQTLRGLEGELRAEEIRRNRGSAAGGGDSASPVIYGTVRGNVTIVTTRGGGRRGSITSIRR
jgi:hypothetical protein